MIKESCHVTVQEAQLVTPPKVVVSVPLLDEELYVKKQDNNSFFPKILLIKKSCNLFGQEVQLAKFNQK